MPKPRLDPAATIVDIIGVGATAKLTQTDRTQVWRWTQPKSERGTGGRIPQAHHDSILTYAERKGLPITADMLIKRRLSKPRRAPARERA